MPEPSAYLSIIKSAERQLQTWRDRAEKIEQRYNDDRGAKGGDRRLNLFWANLEILKPALFSRAPIPAIERRHGGRDPLARLASEILNRACLFLLNAGRFEDAMKAGRDDWLVAGLGQVWVRYEPVYGPGAAGGGAAPPGASQGAGAEEAAAGDGREVVWERVCYDHVPWGEFGFWPTKSWASVQIVWRSVFLTEAAARERFGEAAATLNYDVDPSGDGERVRERGAGEKVARLFEVWDKPRRVVCWINPRGSEAAAVLKEAPDPLKLADFFPCPKPLHATLTRGRFVPIPDYHQIQDQLLDVDETTAAISRLTKRVRVRGVYNKAATGLNHLLRDGGNDLVGVENWAHFAGQQGGLKGNIEWWPLGTVLEAINSLVQLRERQKGDLYEVSGVSDVLRGATEASETLGAQRLKSRYAGVRLQDRQEQAAAFARDCLAITAEIVSEQFSADTLALMTGLADPAEQALIVGDAAVQAAPDLFEQALQLLKQDVVRTFRIEIETDSTIADVVAADQEQVQQLMSVLQQVLASMAQMAGAPALLPMFKEVLLLALRKHRVGRAVEGKIEQALDAAIKQVMERPPAPGPAEAALAREAAAMLKSYKDQKLRMGVADPAYEQSLEAFLAKAAGGAGLAPGIEPPGPPGVNGPAGGAMQ